MNFIVSLSCILNNQFFLYVFRNIISIQISYYVQLGEACYFLSYFSILVNQNLHFKIPILLVFFCIFEQKKYVLINIYDSTIVL